jgi:hypothetical protein
LPFSEMSATTRSLNSTHFQTAVWFVATKRVRQVLGIEKFALHICQSYQWEMCGIEYESWLSPVDAWGGEDGVSTVLGSSAPVLVMLTWRRFSVQETPTLHVDHWLRQLGKRDTAYSTSNIIRPMARPYCHGELHRVSP